MPKVSQRELDWMAESDADTMARYEEILSDPSRMRAATKVAKKKAADLNKRAAAMNKVATKKRK